MKTITLHEPWASLIVDGHKTVETRSWAPPWNIIGHRIAIHAAKREAKFTDWDHELQRHIIEHYGAFAKFPQGAVLGTAILAAAGQVTYIDEKDEPPTAYAVYPSPQRSVTIDPFGDFSQGVISGSLKMW